MTMPMVSPASNPPCAVNPVPGAGLVTRGDTAVTHRVLGPIVGKPFPLINKPVTFPARTGNQARA
ncbi:hypothetical protein [Actinoplanes sp. NPDC051851]|uniref:hypothetical protein n=1 Tax=Actinoplanes sp. NPDC051851 TaxID=3154753 RepID=UPI003448C19C